MLSDWFIIAGLSCILIGVLGLVLRLRRKPAAPDAGSEEPQ